MSSNLYNILSIVTTIIILPLRVITAVFYYSTRVYYTPVITLGRLREIFHLRVEKGRNNPPLKKKKKKKKKTAGG